MRPRRATRDAPRSTHHSSSQREQARGASSTNGDGRRSSLTAWYFPPPPIVSSSPDQPVSPSPCPTDIARPTRNGVGRYDIGIQFSYAPSACRSRRPIPRSSRRSRHREVPGRRRSARRARVHAPEYDSATRPRSPSPRRLRAARAFTGGVAGSGRRRAARWRTDGAAGRRAGPGDRRQRGQR